MLCGQNADIFDSELGAVCINHESQGLKLGLVEGRRWFLSHDCIRSSTIPVRHTFVNGLQRRNVSISSCNHVQCSFVGKSKAREVLLVLTFF
jgi:hypothetical protein